MLTLWSSSLSLTADVTHWIRSGADLTFIRALYFGYGGWASQYYKSPSLNTILLLMCVKNNLVWQLSLSRICLFDLALHILRVYVLYWCPEYNPSISEFLISRFYPIVSTYSSSTSVNWPCSYLHPSILLCAFVYVHSPYGADAIHAEKSAL